MLSPPKVCRISSSIKEGFKKVIDEYFVSTLTCVPVKMKKPREMIVAPLREEVYHISRNNFCSEINFYFPKQLKEFQILRGLFLSDVP